MIYTLENTRNYLKFTVDEVKHIDSEPWGYPMIKVQDLQIKFSDYDKFAHFLYCLKRQSDFDTDDKNNQQQFSNLDKNLLKYNVALDSSMNVISTRSAEDEKQFLKDLEKFHRIGRKCFWGNYIDLETLEVKVGSKKIKLEYSSEKKSEDDKIAIIQPPDKEYDETQLVYVQTDQKPTKSLEISYLFVLEEDGGNLLYKGTRKNDWIY